MYKKVGFCNVKKFAEDVSRCICRLVSALHFFGRLCLNKVKHRFSSNLRWGGGFVEAPVTIVLAQMVA